MRGEPLVVKDIKIDPRFKDKRYLWIDTIQTPSYQHPSR